MNAPPPAYPSAGPADRRRSQLSEIAHRLGADSMYVLVGFPIALASFILVITGFSMGIGMLVTFVGLPILAVTIFIARGFADIERLRAGPVLGIQLRRPAYRRARPGEGWWQRFLRPLGDPQSWLDMLYPIIAFPVTIVTWSIGVTWWSGTLAGLTYPLWGWALPNGDDDQDLPELLGFGDGITARLVFNLFVGVFFLFTLVPVMRGCALAQAHLTKGLLSGVAELQARITGLEREKADADARTATAQARTASAVSAEATALRRLERDIHDGPQQRLVRLAMDLGRAQHQLDRDDPTAARATVTEAIAQTRETLDELRALSRGIAPPILVDRGLTAALTALAGRSTIPVDLEAEELGGRLASGVESAAYFVVAEALTNVAKHSHATECRVTLQRTDEAILVIVSDNGVGGAHVSKGHGLAGLSDRVNAAGGQLAVGSPQNGSGTIVTAMLPL